jgi:aminopeptidase YwaD
MPSLAALLVSVLLITSAAAGQTKAEAGVCAECIRKNMEYLASDELQGRGSGTEDEHKAADYIASYLKTCGIQPAGDNGGFIQRAPIVHRTVTSVPRLTVHSSNPNSATAPTTFIYGKDFLTIYLAQARFTGPLQKIDAEKGAGEMIPGAIALITGKDARRERDVALSALQAGAVAALVLAVNSSPEYFSWGVDNLPVLSATLEKTSGAADNLNVLELSKSAINFLMLAPEGVQIQFDAPVKEEPGYTWSVIGMLPGTSLALQHSAIVLSAHLDHLGNGTPMNGDKIYNGADDDASGVSAVLEMARIMSSREKPLRTVIFALFGSEEMRGLGSTYFSQHPPIPLGDMAANLEFEMIGRPDPAVDGDTLWLSGWERSNLGPKLAEHGAHLVADPHPKENFFTRSDNYILAKKGIVAHTISSFGVHKQYHQPDDDLAHIDFNHMNEAIRSLLPSILWLVNSDFTPQWNTGGQP